MVEGSVRDSPTSRASQPGTCLALSLLLGSLGFGSSCAARVARPNTALPFAAVPLLPVAPPRSPAECRRAGLNWLLTNQLPDGSFGTFESSRTDEVYLDTQSSHRAFHVATTALGAMALITPAQSNHAAEVALERAVTWLLAQEPVGQASGGTFYDTWAHTYLIELAARLLSQAPATGDSTESAPPSDAAATELSEQRARALRTLELRALLATEITIALRRQATDGGWGYYDFQGSFDRATGQQTTSFNTGAMILALRAARAVGAEVPEARLVSAVERLRKFRLPDGAFVYGTYADLRPMAGFNRPSGSSGRLQVCQLALFDSGVASVDQTALASGLAYLRDRHHYIEIGRGRPIPHEAFYSNSGYYYFFGHYHAARVVTALTDANTREDYRAWLDTLLLSIQNSDGSWFDYPLYGYGHAYATAYAMLALQQLDALGSADQDAATDAEAARMRSNSSQNPG